MNSGFGFNLGKYLSRLDLIANVRQVDGKDRAERRLDIIREPEMNVAIFYSNPYMLDANSNFLFLNGTPKIFSISERGLSATPFKSKRIFPCAAEWSIAKYRQQS